MYCNLEISRSVNYGRAAVHDIRCTMWYDLHMSDDVWLVSVFVREAEAPRVLLPLAGTVTLLPRFWFGH